MNIPIPIQTIHRNQTLVGYISKIADNTIYVKLTDPIKGKALIQFGYGSAMMGHHIYNNEGNLTKHAYDAAQRALTWAYDNYYAGKREPYTPQKQLELEAKLEVAENRIKVLEQTLEFERERYRVNVEYLEEEYAAKIVKNKSKTKGRA